MSRRAAQTYRREWAGRAIGLDIDIDADPNVLAGLTLGSAINGFVLSRGQGTEPNNEYHKSRPTAFTSHLRTHRSPINGRPHHCQKELWTEPSATLTRLSGASPVVDHNKGLLCETPVVIAPATASGRQPAGPALCDYACSASCATSGGPHASRPIAWFSRHGCFMWRIVYPERGIA